MQLLSGTPTPLKDIQQTEGAQKFALKVCMKDWSSSSDTLLGESDLSKQNIRRNYLSLCHFKITSASMYSPWCPAQSLSAQWSPYSLPEPEQLWTAPSPDKCPIFFFFSRVIREWNSLHLTVTSSQTLLLNLISMLCKCFLLHEPWTLSEALKEWIFSSTTFQITIIGR